MTVMYGGTASQGTPIGILMSDAPIARIPGDVGNAFTYEFPVRFYTVPGSSTERTIESTDYSLVDAYIEGAKVLEAEGCQAITTSCGFLIAFQKQIAASVHVPVFTSSLLQAPLVAQFLQPGKKVGILTANSDTLDPGHFLTGGLTRDDIAIQGMQTYKAFYTAFPGDAYSYVYEEVEAEMLDAARTLLRNHPDIGAIVCEGTNMAPFTPAINRATGLPIFDIITLIRFVTSGLLRGMTSPFGNRLTGGDTSVPPQWGRPPRSI